MREKHLFFMEKESRKFKHCGLRLDSTTETKLTDICAKTGKNPSEVIRWLIHKEYDQKAEENKTQNIVQSVMQPVLEKLAELQKMIEVVPAKKKGADGRPSKSDRASNHEAVLKEIMASSPSFALGFEGMDEVPPEDASEKKFDWKSYGQYLLWCRTWEKTPSAEINMAIRKKLAASGLDENTGRGASGARKEG